MSEIQDLNPALLKSVAPAGYQLRVPKGTLPAVMAALDLVPANHRADWRIHRVVPGETLAEIAHRYATPVSALTSANQRAALNAPAWRCARRRRPAGGSGCSHASHARGAVARCQLPAASPRTRKARGLAPDTRKYARSARSTPAPTTPPASPPSIAPQ